MLLCNSRYRIEKISRSTTVSIVPSCTSIISCLLIRKFEGRLDVVENAVVEIGQYYRNNLQTKSEENKKNYSQLQAEKLRK